MMLAMPLHWLGSCERKENKKGLLSTFFTLFQFWDWDLGIMYNNWDNIFSWVWILKKFTA